MDVVWGVGVYGVRAWVNFFVYYTTFALIAFGVFSQIWDYRKTRFDLNYLIIALLSGGVLVAFVTIPFISIGYTMMRTFPQMYVILAPMFVIGGLIIAKNNRRLSTLIVVGLLILQLFASTGIINMAFGLGPTHVSLTRETDLHKMWDVHDSEIIGARWLLDHKGSDELIHSDGFAIARFLLADSADGSPISINNMFLANKTQEEGYLFLRHTNVVYNKVFLGWWCEGINIDEFSHLFIEEKKSIYDSGDVVVYQL